jgi:hypothetical protein
MPDATASTDMKPDAALGGRDGPCQAPTEPATQADQRRKTREKRLT